MKRLWNLNLSGENVGLNFVPSRRVMVISTAALFNRMTITFKIPSCVIAVQNERGVYEKIAVTYLYDKENPIIMEKQICASHISVMSVLEIPSKAGFVFHEEVLQHEENFSFKQQVTVKEVTDIRISGNLHIDVHEKLRGLTSEEKIKAYRLVPQTEIIEVDIEDVPSVVWEDGFPAKDYLNEILGDGDVVLVRNKGTVKVTLEVKEILVLIFVSDILLVDNRLGVTRIEAELGLEEASTLVLSDITIIQHLTCKT